MNKEEFLSVNKNAIDRGDIGSVSDGYHTFDQLYNFRKLYNAAFFNLMSNNGYLVFKSKKHSDGELCFGGGWFIVQAELPIGLGSAQISNHYEMKDWDLFHIQELDKAMEWDGHTDKDVEDRLLMYIKDN